MNIKCGPLAHRGLDLCASAGQAIPALRSGIVRREGRLHGPLDGIPGPNTYAGLANLLD